MGLAVPAALTVAVGRGAQLGVLFKGGEALERLAHLDAIVLDKTGTLTVGRPVLDAVQLLAGHSGRRSAAHGRRAEERSNHPLAHAMVDAARARGLVWPPAEDVQILPGRGLSAKVEGHDCVLGNEALFREFFIPLPNDAIPRQSRASRACGWLWTTCPPATSTPAMRSAPMRPRPSPRCARPVCGC